MKKKKNIIIGAGFTGLGAGLASGFKILEASRNAGGICASYQKDGFKFEIGGGHWIFGGDPLVLKVMDKYARFKKYNRKSAVFFAGNTDYSQNLKHCFVDYPIQNNLCQLKDNSLVSDIVNEIVNAKNTEIPDTMEDWMRINFGETLCRLFFYPFHARYTAGLFKEIAPQDGYKSPFKVKDVIKGAFANSENNAGYNVSYLYPEDGLDSLAMNMAAGCNIDYNSAVVEINKDKRTVVTASGEETEYEYLISTMPLNRTLEMADINADTEPYTSVMVLNLGVELADNEMARHGNHWLYIPDSKTGFHRVGYYSNVDPLFLPEMNRNPEKYASLYVEFAFRNGIKPTEEEIEDITLSTIEELKEWNFIKKVITYDPTWIEVAYTWNRPNYNSTAKFVDKLSQYNIISAGRYGRWNFQGIAESLREGLQIGSSVKLLAK